MSVQEGQNKSVYSVTQMNTFCNRMAKQFACPDKETRDHRMINSYLHAYKNMLSLSSLMPGEKKALFKDPFKVTVDFTQLNKVRKLALHTGYDAMNQA